MMIDGAPSLTFINFVSNFFHRDSSEESYKESDSDEDDDDDDEDAESSSESEPIANSHKTIKTNNQTKNTKSSAATTSTVKAERSNLDLLLDLDDIAPIGPIMTPSLGGFLSPSQMNATVASNAASRFELVGPSLIPFTKHELLNKINGHGLLIHYRFTRAPHLFSAKMVSIELTLKNDSNEDIESIHVSDTSMVKARGYHLHEFAPIAKLGAGQSTQNVIGIDFNDSTHSIDFDIKSSVGIAHVSLRVSVGELIRSVQINESIFDEEQSRLRGMNEHRAIVKIGDGITSTMIRSKIFEVANVAIVIKSESSPNLANFETIDFAGLTLASQSLVLIAIAFDANERQVTVTVKCEKMVIGSMLLNDIKTALCS